MNMIHKGLTGLKHPVIPHHSEKKSIRKPFLLVSFLLQFTIPKHSKNFNFPGQSILSRPIASNQSFIMFARWKKSLCSIEVIFSCIVDKYGRTVVRRILSRCSVCGNAIFN